MTRWSQRFGNPNSASVVFGAADLQTMHAVVDLLGDRVNYVVYSRDEQRWFVITTKNFARDDALEIANRIDGKADLYFYDRVWMRLENVVGELVHRLPDYRIDRGIVVEGTQ